MYVVYGQIEGREVLDETKILRGPLCPVIRLDSLRLRSLVQVKVYPGVQDFNTLLPLRI